MGLARVTNAKHTVLRLMHVQQFDIFYTRWDQSIFGFEVSQQFVKMLISVRHEHLDQHYSGFEA